MAAREMFMTATILRLTKLCGGERASGNGGGGGFADHESVLVKSGRRKIDKVWIPHIAKVRARFHPFLTPHFQVIKNQSKKSSEVSFGSFCQKLNYKFGRLKTYSLGMGRSLLVCSNFVRSKVGKRVKHKRVRHLTHSHSCACTPACAPHSSSFVSDDGSSHRRASRCPLVFQRQRFVWHDHGFVHAHLVQKRRSRNAWFTSRTTSRSSRLKSTLEVRSEANWEGFAPFADTTTLVETITVTPTVAEDDLSVSFAVAPSLPLVDCSSAFRGEKQKSGNTLLGGRQTPLFAHVSRSFQVPKITHGCRQLRRFGPLKSPSLFHPTFRCGCVTPSESRTGGATGGTLRDRVGAWSNFDRDCAFCCCVTRRVEGARDDNRQKCKTLVDAFARSGGRDDALGPRTETTTEVTSHLFRQCGRTTHTRLVTRITDCLVSSSKIRFGRASASEIPLEN